MPTLINIQAFRQRYNWLWQQYQAQLAAAVASGNKTAISDVLTRAQSTWQRWYQIDRDNSAMLQQMATLQATAGRDAEAWRYLSTVVDLKPKDAASHNVISSWYRGRGDLDQAQQRLATAYQWDSANPRWLFERGELLVKLGRQSEARQVFQQILDGKWASGLQGYVTKARQAISQ